MSTFPRSFFLSKSYLSSLFSSFFTVFVIFVLADFTPESFSNLESYYLKILIVPYNSVNMKEKLQLFLLLVFLFVFSQKENNDLAYSQHFKLQGDSVYCKEVT